MKCVETVSLLREQEKRCYRVSLCNRKERKAMWQCGSVAVWHRSVLLTILTLRVVRSGRMGNIEISAVVVYKVFPVPELHPRQDQSTCSFAKRCQSLYTT